MGEGEAGGIRKKRAAQRRKTRENGTSLDTPNIASAPPPSRVGGNVALCHWSKQTKTKIHISAFVVDKADSHTTRSTQRKFRSLTN